MKGGKGHIYKTIKEIFEETGMSQQKFADTYDTNRRTLQDLIYDVNKTTTFREINRYARLNDGQILYIENGHTYEVTIHEVTE